MMLNKKIWAILLTLVLLSACAAQGQVGSAASSSAEQSSQESASISEASSPASEEPTEASSASQEPPDASSASQSDPEEPQQSQPESQENPAAAYEALSQEERDEVDRNRDALMAYLEDTLTPEEYTNFFITKDQMGLGVDSPELQTVKEAVAAYDGPAVQVEYREVANSRARLDAAWEAYCEMRDSLRGTDGEIVANVSYSGIGDGYIHITIHQMNPELQEFLDTSEYGDCFQVEVTGADDPIVNPDT